MDLTILARPAEVQKGGEVDVQPLEHLYHVERGDTIHAWEMGEGEGALLWFGTRRERRNNQFAVVSMNVFNEIRRALQRDNL